MDSQAKPVRALGLGWTRPVYLFLLFGMGLTGFAQMPIFKRYYIADIPGLGWLARFYVTHYMHYVGAALLLFFIVYAASVYLLMLRRDFALTITAYLRIILLASIAATGIFRVLKNLPDVVFSPGFTMFIDISHLGFMMLLICTGAIAMTIKQPWLVHRR